MPIGVRAGIAVTMLAGFYALIGTVMVALAFGLGLLVGYGGWAMLAAVVLYVMLIGLAAGLGRGLKAPRFEPHGTQLLETDQPRLWALVRDLAERVGTRPPDEIWLVPEVNAAVTEQTKLLGLRGGQRYLVLGIPVLMALSVEQLCAVLAHELGHYSHSHTRLVEINYRARTAVAAAYVRLKRINPLRWLFAGYARLYFLVEAAVSRQQELEADRAAGRIAGRSAARTALVEIDALATAWDLYAGRYVEPGLSYGIAPARVYTGFTEFLHARRDELDELREHIGHATGTRWDSHPPTHVRVAALADAPEVGVYSDARPAWQLMSEPEAFLDKAERAFDFGERRLLDWPEYVAEGERLAAELCADATYRALSRVTGRVPETLDTVLAACERGEFDELWSRMEQRHAPEWGLSAMVTAAALRSGAGRIEHRFDGAPRLVFTDGSELDVDKLLSPLLEGEDPSATVAGIRAKLLAHGIDPARARTGQLRFDGAFTEAIGAMPYVKVNGDWKDLVLTTGGIVVMPGPENRIQDLGKKRMAELIRTTRPQDLIADPRNLWIPYEEMASAIPRREITLWAEVRLYDGTTYELKEAGYGAPVGNAREELYRFLSALAEAN